VVYAFTLQWPMSGKLVLGAVEPAAHMNVSMLGYPRPVQWEKRREGGIVVDMPTIPYSELPCLWAWTFKLENVA